MWRLVGVFPPILTRVVSKLQQNNGLSNTICVGGFDGTDINNRSKLGLNFELDPKFRVKAKEESNTVKDCLALKNRANTLLILPISLTVPDEKQRDPLVQAETKEEAILFVDTQQKTIQRFNPSNYTHKTPRFFSGHWTEHQESDQWKHVDHELKKFYFKGYASVQIVEAATPYGDLLFNNQQCDTRPNLKMMWALLYAHLLVVIKATFSEITTTNSDAQANKAQDLLDVKFGTMDREKRTEWIKRYMSFVREQASLQLISEFSFSNATKTKKENKEELNNVCTETFDDTSFKPLSESNKTFLKLTFGKSALLWQTPLWGASSRLVKVRELGLQPLVKEQQYQIALRTLPPYSAEKITIGINYDLKEFMRFAKVDDAPGLRFPNNIGVRVGLAEWPNLVEDFPSWIDALPLDFTVMRSERTEKNWWHKLFAFLKMFDSRVARTSVLQRLTALQAIKQMNLPNNIWISEDRVEDWLAARNLVLPSEAEGITKFDELLLLPWWSTKTTQSTQSSSDTEKLLFSAIMKETYLRTLMYFDKSACPLF